MENAIRPVTMARLSGGETVLLLAVSCASGETLGSSQPELRNTRFSTAGLERFSSSVGPLRKTSYLVITPGEKSELNAEILVFFFIFSEHCVRKKIF